MEDKLQSEATKEEKIRKGAEDFAERFLPVMKELAEEEGAKDSWENRVEQFFYDPREASVCLPDVEYGKTKDFIRSLIEAVRKEERERIDGDVLSVLSDWRYLLQKGVGYCHVNDLFTLESEIRRIITGDKE